MLQKVCKFEAKEKRLRMNELSDKIERVLHENNKEGARALLPQLRVLCRKLDRVRSFGKEFSSVGLSEYAMAVAALAGRKKEFAEYV